MSFRESAHDELRKNRNDLILIKDNLLIPEDIDRGPTEDMININDIIIPPWVRVCEIPTNLEAVSDQRKEFLDVLDECIKVIDATANIVKADGPFRFSDNAIDYEAVELYSTYLQKTYQLLIRAGSLIPVNFNMYLIRVAAYANILAGRVEPMLKQVENLFADATLRAIFNSEEYVQDIYYDMKDWLGRFETAFENGVYCGDYDTQLSPLTTDAAELLSRICNMIVKVSGGSYLYHNILKDTLDTQSALHRVISTDYHLERSKAPFISFDSTVSSENQYIPKLPYDYVHQRYYVEIEDTTEDITDISDHILEHTHHRIGDIIV